MIRPYRRRPGRQDIAVFSEEGTLSEGNVRTVTYGYRRDAATRAAHQDGHLVTYGERPIRWVRPDRSSVILLGQMDGVPPAELLEGLVTLRDFVHEAGGSMGSIGHIGYSIARATVGRVVMLGRGDPPKLRELIGGRKLQGRVPGLYGAAKQIDLPAAYASVLGALPVGGVWHRVRPDYIGEQTTSPCFVSAEVRVPDLVHGPLPRRKKARTTSRLGRALEHREYPTGTTVKGIWSLPEILAAERSGCRVKRRAAWVAPAADAPLAEWWQVMQEARRLPGVAGDLAKAASNALWARFVHMGDREIRWSDGERWQAKPYPLPSPPWDGLDLAETVAGTIRARLFTEVLQPLGHFVWSADTDGALVPERTHTPEGWRTKLRGNHVVYLDPHHYMIRDRAGVPHYTAAGSPPATVLRDFWSLADLLLGENSKELLETHRPVRLQLDPRRAAATYLRTRFPELTVTEAYTQVDDWFGPGEPKIEPAELTEFKELMTV